MNQDNATNETLIRMDVIKWADYLSTMQPIAMNGMAFRIENTHRPEMNATFDGIDVRIVYFNDLYSAYNALQYLQPKK